MLAFEISDRVWLWASLCVLLVALCLRLYALELKPMHHDEGVNGFFLTNLVRNGVYRYDPANYHGPTLYYFTLPLVSLFGLETWTLRLLTVLSGTGLVALPLMLHRRIGRFGALSAAALLAVSPGAIFFARYYIHETPFVFLTVASVVAWLRYTDTARTIYFMLAALSLALLFATKETAFISLGVLLIAAALTHVYMRLRGRMDAHQEARHARGKRNNAQRAPDALRATNVFSVNLERFGGAERVALLAVTGALLFALVNVIYYSSFFTNAAGIADALRAFAIWKQTGESDFHAKPFGTYFGWLQKEEAALYALGIVGAIWAVCRATNRFAVFVALWAGGIIAAYSLVPYKTPWLVLNFIPPLAIAGGYLLDALAASLQRMKNSQSASSASNFSAWSALAPFAAVVLLVIALGIGGYRSLALNFDHYDDDTFSYVYAHSTRDLTQLGEDIKRIAERSGDKPTISIHAPDYWPLPWYFRDYTVTGYPPQALAAATATMLILSSEQAAEAESALAGSYREIGRYHLRPGVELALFARSEIAG